MTRASVQGGFHASDTTTEFTPGTAISLENAGIGSGEESSLILVRGEVQDYETYTGIDIDHPSAILIVEEVTLLEESSPPTDLENPFLIDEDDLPIE